MSKLTLIATVILLFAPAAHAQQEQQQQPKLFFPKIDFGAGALRGERSIQDARMDGLTFNLRTAVFEEVPDPAGNRFGEIQVVVDVYGSNLPDGGTKIDLRKLKWTVFQRLLNERPQAIISGRFDVIDVTHEKLDDQRSFVYAEWMGFDFIVKPLAQTRSPIRLVMTAHLGFSPFGGTHSLHTEEMHQSIRARTREQQEQFLKDNCAECDESSPLWDYGGARLSTEVELDIARRLRFFYSRDRIAQNTGKSNNGRTLTSSTMTVKRDLFQVAVPLNQWLKGRDVEIVGSYQHDAFDTAAFGLFNRYENREYLSHFRFPVDQKGTIGRLFVGASYRFNR
ncbi:MAG TPA: hypothetical protein VM598_07615 [Bdellovibrionota bacterium]|nr:hypothetical protein [Bdellovibrionota bacterium]